MILKLRQGIGRLIRSPQDTGVIIIFDDRLVTTSWGSRLADALPNGLKIHHVPSRSFLDLYREKKLSKQKIEIPQ
jgi:ATP-dependent DNA helicase DinG